jgi:chemotaxis protein CheX
MPDQGAQDKWSGQIDDIVAEVFRMMLRKSCAAVDGTTAFEVDLSARILLSGSFEGHCMIELPQATAKKLTDAFLGCEADWGNAMIEDAVGELCNMIAGGWKSKLGAFASASDLSVPTISQGPHHNTLDEARIKMRRVYAFDNSAFTVSLAIL